MRRLSSAIAVIASLALASCSGNGGDGNDLPDAGSEPNALACGSNHTAITAQQLYDDVIKLHCQSCHFTGTSEATTLVLDSVEAVQATAGQASTYPQGLLVTEANHSENSTLFLKSAGGTVPGGIRGPKGQAIGNAMPNTGTRLTDAELAKIKDWICTGAH